MSFGYLGYQKFFGSQVSDTPQNNTTKASESNLHSYHTARYYIKHGYIRYSSGQYDKAIINFNKALKIDPTPNMPVYNALGDSYYALGNYREAYKNYKKAGNLKKAKEAKRKMKVPR